MLPFPSSPGTWAQYVTIDANLIVRVPTHIDLVAAASLPLAGLTARMSLDRLALDPGSTVLVLGAAGAVGSLLTQMASAAGLRVFAGSRPERRSLLSDLGATGWVDRFSSDPVRAVIRLAEGPVDAIVDLVGNHELGRHMAAVRAHGQLLSIMTPDLDLDAVLDNNLSFHGVLVETDQKRLQAVADLVASGAVSPTVAKVMPLQHAASAQQLVASGTAGGKVVLTTGL